MRKKSATSKVKFDRQSPGVANPVDIHVGTRLRLRRTLLGFSQEKLGEAVGLTFQQIQKYERGANRMGASRLYQFAQILNVSESYFFDELPENLQTAEGQKEWGLNDQAQEALSADPLARRETLEFVRAYYKIHNDEIRDNIISMIKALSDTDGKS